MKNYIFSIFCFIMSILFIIDEVGLITHFYSNGKFISGKAIFDFFGVHCSFFSKTAIVINTIIIIFFISLGIYFYYRAVRIKKNKKCVKQENNI